MWWRNSWSITRQTHKRTDVNLLIHFQLLCLTLQHSHTFLHSPKGDLRGGGPNGNWSVLVIIDRARSSPVPELSFLPASYRDWTRAGERRLLSPARVQPLYGAGRKNSSGTGLSKKRSKNVRIRKINMPLVFAQSALFELFFFSSFWSVAMMIHWQISTESVWPSQLLRVVNRIQSHTKASP